MRWKRRQTPHTVEIGVRSGAARRQRQHWRNQVHPQPIMPLTPTVAPADYRRASQRPAGSGCRPFAQYGGKRLTAWREKKEATPFDASVTIRRTGADSLRAACTIFSPARRGFPASRELQAAVRQPHSRSTGYSCAAFFSSASIHSTSGTPASEHHIPGPIPASVLNAGTDSSSPKHRPRGFTVITSCPARQMESMMSLNSLAHGRADLARLALATAALRRKASTPHRG